jgi:uncharacterized protein YndB with AHSA1/START domain
VRYADGPTVEVEVEVAAPPAVVWALVTDIDLPARFSTEFQGGDWEAGATEPAVGARFTGRNEHPAIGAWETHPLVIECEIERVFAYVIGDPDHPSATWGFEIEALDEGRRSRLRQRARMGPGPSGLTPAIEARPDAEERIVARRLEEWRANMHATVEGVKALAEGAPQ